MKSGVQFVELIDSFVSEKIDANEFETSYLTYFLKENPWQQGVEYDLLNEIFWDVEDYVEDSDIRDDGELDAEQLRAKCEKKLVELRQILSLG